MDGVDYGCAAIETDDPMSPRSVGYHSGWGFWWENHPEAILIENPVFYRWSIDMKRPNIDVEVLRPVNYYEDSYGN